MVVPEGMSLSGWNYTDNDGSSLYCQLCDYKAGTTAGYEAHIHGFKHKKQVELAQNDPDREIRSNQNHDFHCSLCDIFCSSKEMLNTHLRGQKHLKKRANSDNSVGFYQNNDRNSKTSVLEGKLVDFDKAVVGLDFIVEIHPSDNKKEPRFLCELCNAKSDIRVIGSHLIGQKHRQNYMKHTRWTLYNSMTKGKYNAKIKPDELERLMIAYEAKDGRGRVVIREEMSEEYVTVELDDIKDEESVWGHESVDGSVRDQDYRFEEDRKVDLGRIEQERESRPGGSTERSPTTWKNVLTELLKKFDDFEVEDEEEASYALSIAHSLTHKLLTYRLGNILSPLPHVVDIKPDISEY